MCHGLQILIIEGVFPGPGIVNDLVRDHDHAGFDVSPDAAHGADRNDGVGPCLFQRPEIRPVVDFVWRDGMRSAMAGKENDALSL